MKSINNSGADFYLAPETLKATILMSLLTVWVLIGVFIFLKRYTKRRHFTVWTAGWLFYVVWLTLNMQDLGSAPTSTTLLIEQWCLAVVAVFLFWGSVRFMGLRVKELELGLFLAFLLVWSYVGAHDLGHPMAAKVSLFGLLGGVSLLTAVCFARYRRRRGFVGATMLAIGFLLWGAYIVAYPFIQAASSLSAAGFFISAVLQLFIALSMVILVLEEMRGTNLQAIERLRYRRCEASELQTKIDATEERYRKIFKQAGDAIIITAAGDLRVLELNDTALRLLGIGRTQAHQHCLPSFCQLPKDSKVQAGDTDSWVNLLCGQSRVGVISKSGALTLSEVDAVKTEYSGQPAYQFFFREVTEKTRLEQQLRQAQKLSTLGQMISGVAHEMNSPLAVIKGYLDLILEHHEIGEKTRADLTKVTQECNRTIKLVRNFLSFARSQPEHREMNQLNALIERAADLRRVDLRTRNVELILDLAPDLPATCADPDQMQQLTINIVNNAVQAMAAQTAPRKLKISTCAKSHDWLLIGFEDSGPGVPSELRQKIFEPFFTTKPAGAGTGLGLSIAHGILADHHGRIYYKTSCFGGAGFFLELPVLNARSQTSAPDIETKPRNSLKTAAEVLVLDDEPSIADLLSEMLSLLGQRPTVCLAPAAALELLLTRDFDLIISDFRMPVMNGEQFYREVLRRKPHLAPNIIFLTGDVVSAETRQFLASTNNPHLDKPFQLSKLETVVAEVLGRKEARRDDAIHGARPSLAPA